MKSHRIILNQTLTENGLGVGYSMAPAERSNLSVQMLRSPASLGNSRGYTCSVLATFGYFALK